MVLGVCRDAIHRVRPRFTIPIAIGTPIKQKKNGNRFAGNWNKNLKENL